MANSSRRVIQVVSHGPSCFDGVVAAATVARFYQGHRVLPILAANGESDQKIQALRPKSNGEGDEVWITDLSWNSTATGEHLRSLADAGVSVYWIDHHRSAVSRADAPEFKVPFRGKVLSERYSAARLTFNFLKRRAPKAAGSAARMKAFERFFPIVELADDHDRWVKRLPASADWALAIQTLGGAQAYREILRLDEPIMTARLKAALEQGRAAMAEDQLPLTKAGSGAWSCRVVWGRPVLAFGGQARVEKCDVGEAFAGVRGSHARQQSSGQNRPYRHSWTWVGVKSRQV